jgi:putative oxidoreductase
MSQTVLSPNRQQTPVALARLTLVTGRFGLVVLAGARVGIMSPLVLFPDDLFGGGPTIVAQHVIKDVVLVAGSLVVAAHALGGRMRSDSSG